MKGKSGRIILMMLLVGMGVVSRAQAPSERLDIDRIPQRAVRDLVRKEKVSTANDFQKIATACYSVDDSSSYQTNLKTYTVKEKIGKVWEKYTNLSPRKAWSGRTVKFGFLFSKLQNRFVYAEEADEPIRVGNIIYVNLRLLKGIKNLGVAFEVTKLDEASKTICFCYLEDGISTGSQEISFTELSNGNTKISHLTHYRSHSAFRDRELYPIFHSKFVGEFHHNILHQIDKGV